MNEWLRRYASQSRRDDPDDPDDTAANWIIATPECPIAAFASMSITGLDRSKAPTSLGKGSPNPVPGLRIGRLAADEEVEGGGIETAVVCHTLALAVELRIPAACGAIVVVALHAGAKAWLSRVIWISRAADAPVTSWGSAQVCRLGRSGKSRPPRVGSYAVADIGAMVQVVNPMGARGQHTNRSLLLGGSTIIDPRLVRSS